MQSGAFPRPAGRLTRAWGVGMRWSQVPPSNLIVVEQARGWARVGFWAYARPGAPLTFGTMAFGLSWLAWGP